MKFWKGMLLTGTIWVLGIITGFLIAQTRTNFQIIELLECRSMMRRPDVQAALEATAAAEAPAQMNRQEQNFDKINDPNWMPGN